MILATLGWGLLGRKPRFTVATANPNELCRACIRVCGIEFREFVWVAEQFVINGAVGPAIVGARLAEQLLQTRIRQRLLHTNYLWMGK